MIGTLTDATSTRSVGTDYLNNTGEDVFVFFTGQSASGANYSYLEIGVSTSTYQVLSRFQRPNISSAMYWSISGVVPNGYYYRITSTVGDTYWWEYKTQSISTSTASSSLTQAELDTMLEISMEPTYLALVLLGSAFLFIATMTLIMFYFKRK